MKDDAFDLIVCGAKYLVCVGVFIARALGTD